MADLVCPPWLDDPPPTGEGDYFGDVPVPTAAPSNSFDQPPHREPTALLRIINPTDLRFATVPDREWIVEDWLPVGTVTALYGDGETGKTLLAQQLQTATATGRPWCGMEPMRVRSLGLYCEDDEDEMHRRQWSINRALGVDFSALGDMRWISGVGTDCTLMNFLEGRTVFSALRDWLLTVAKDFGARLLILDTAADLFGGNENDRHQVRQFVGMLSRGALEISGAVLLNAHPSRAGLRTGDHDGGSTAWNNSVRSRWSLHRPPGDADADADTDARVLTRRKANYASIGDAIRLRWQAGALLPQGSPGVAANHLARAECETVFLTLLRRLYGQSVWVSSSRNATSYAPKLFARQPDHKGCGKRDFETAMHALIACGRVVLESYGRSSDMRQRLAPVPGPASEGTEE